MQSYLKFKIKAKNIKTYNNVTPFKAEIIDESDSMCLSYHIYYKYGISYMYYTHGTKHI